jgi:site-specific recombinase XerC
MRKATAPKPPSFAALVQRFFTEYLVAQRRVSPQTVACYRDALIAVPRLRQRQAGQAADGDAAC